MQYVETRYVLNGIDTAVYTAGIGTPLVFLHGGGTATGFDSLLPLAARCRLIVPIHPGFGASDDDPGDRRHPGLRPALRRAVRRARARGDRARGTLTRGLHRGLVCDPASGAHLEARARFAVRARGAGARDDQPRDHRARERRRLPHRRSLDLLGAPGAADAGVPRRARAGGALGPAGAPRADARREARALAAPADDADAAPLGRG